MNRAQLDHAAAEATGESTRPIRGMSFSLASRPSPDAGLDDRQLVVPCPSCRQPVPSPGRTRDGSPILAERLACDVYFEAPTDVVTRATPPGA